MAGDLSDGLEVATVQGLTVMFTIMGDDALINNANIVLTDIEASNGIIHVIDQVILPPSDEEEMEEPTDDGMGHENQTDGEMDGGDNPPETLPNTGLSLSSNATTFSTIGIVFLALVGVVYLDRRRKIESKN